LSEPAIRLERSTLRLGGREIWSDLDLELPGGGFLTVIGPNGAGKTSLLRVLLGLLGAEGRVQVLGRPPRRGNRRLGYVPQQRALEDVPLRARDLVALGVDGTRWGFGLGSAETRGRVDRLLTQVGASELAEAPVGQLSGGEQQRLRIAQALAGEPELLLCDEPLLSLDLRHQREICELIAAWRERSGGSVVFVTHDVNPVLQLTDSVLALVAGRWAAGQPGEVLTTATMTRLYGSPVDVLRVRGRVVVLAEAFDPSGEHHEHHRDPQPA
jgi:zinc/manganese transport system ATP-binding protein